MKKIKLLFVFLTFIGVKMSFGQIYEKVYSMSSAEVQNHMNQNKIQAIDILTGVKAHHVVGISGVTVANKSTLESLLSNQPKVLNFQVAADATSVIIDSEARFTREELEQVLQPLNVVILNYAVDFSI
jgi:hypothetical protein